MANFAWAIYAPAYGHYYHGTTWLTMDWLSVIPIHRLYATRDDAARNIKRLSGHVNCEGVEKMKHAEPKCIFLIEKDAYDEDNNA